MNLTLEQANTIISAALAKRNEAGHAPMAVVVLDNTGQAKALQREDGTSLMRADIAYGKAWGCIGLGHGGRAQAGLAAQQPILTQAFMNIARGNMVPVPGGVLIRGENSEVLGAVGVSGDTPPVDEAVAIAGIEAAGLQPGVD